jgi:hypothetical protein
LIVQLTCLVMTVIIALLVMKVQNSLGCWIIRSSVVCTSM